MANNNAQKTHLALGLNTFVDAKIQEAMAQNGMSLPARVVKVASSIVTVAFDVEGYNFTLPQVTMPIAGPEYIRMPTQVGDLGVVYPVSVSIGGVSGLGGGTADFSTPSNLSALVFFPCGNANWTPTDDPNAVVVYGPNGVRLRDTGAHSSIILNPTSITLTAGGHTLTINSTGITVNGAFTASGGSNNLSGGTTIDGRVFLNHVHSGVQTGGSDTAGVV